MQKSSANKQVFLTKKFSFDAAHKLPHYKGKCKNLHGHTYFLEVTITGKVDQQTGMVLDFGIVKDIVKESVVEKLDHCYINEIIENPTAENMSKWIWETLDNTFKDHRIQLSEIKLYETPDSWVVYK